LKVTAYPVKSRRITVAKGVCPVFRRRWKWLDIRAQARQGVFVSFRIPPSLSRKLFRSESSRKIFVLSIPREIMWCMASGASTRDFLGMPNRYHNSNPKETAKVKGVPQFRRRRWKWLGIRAQARQDVFVSFRIPPSLSRKLFRSNSSRKILVLSIPRTIMWCMASGASTRDLLGMPKRYHKFNSKETAKVKGVP